MSETLSQAEAVEAEFEQLFAAESLNDQRIGEVLERRDALHRAMVEQLKADERLRAIFQPLFQRAYKNTQQFLERCVAERDDVQQQLITLNTSKKARKAY